MFMQIFIIKQNITRKKGVLLLVLLLMFSKSWGQYWFRQRENRELAIELNKSAFILGDTLVVTVTNKSNRSFCNPITKRELKPGEKQLYTYSISKKGKDKISIGFIHECKPKYKMHFGRYWEILYMTPSKEYIVK